MSSKTPAKPTPDRDARLKAALKANMARRKAQARARSANGQAEAHAGRRQAAEAGNNVKEDR